MLQSLKPADEFNLLVYNDKVTPYSPAPVAVTPEAVEKALDFLRAAALRGGTNLQAALDAALAQPMAHDPYIVVLGDLGATRGILQNGKLAEWYTGEVEASGGGAASAHLRFRDRRRRQSAAGADAGAQQRRAGIGAVHGADRFQAEGVLVEDRQEAGGQSAISRRPRRRISI